MSFPRLSAAAWLILIGLALLVPAVLAAALLTGGPLSLRSALLAARGAVGVLRLVAGAGAGLLLVGLAIYVGGPARSPAEAARDWASYRTMLAMLALAAIFANLLALAHSLITQPGPAASPTAGTLVVSITALELALLGVLHLRIVHPGVLGWQDLGLTARHVGAYALLGVLTAVVLIVVVGALGALLRSAGVQQTQFRMYEGIRGAPLWLYFCLLVAAAGLAPLAEESFFRGYVFTACERTKGRWQAYLFSAGLFAVAHLNLPALLPIFVLGLGFAFVRDRTRSLVPTVVAHAINNALALSALYFAPSLPGGAS